MQSKQYFTKIKNYPHEKSTEPYSCRFFACLGKTKNPDSVWKSGFYRLLLFFKVVPPGIEPFASVYSNSLSDCTFFALSFMKTIELALR